MKRVSILPRELWGWEKLGGLWYKPGKNFALKTPNHLHVDSAAVKPGGEQVAAITPLFL